MGSPEASEVDRKEEEERRGRKSENREDEEAELGEEGSQSKRPSRKRKKVERYSVLSPRKISASKSLLIEQGPGTKLKDIPNVVFKLSKRKADDSLQALHTILFRKKSNVHFLKRNILQFSGFVWTENEEKHKAKLKEKLDKYTKEKLIDFCGLLDIQFPKTTTKKEDVSSKLLGFLESPHVTRDLLLADKDKKGKKRRSITKATQDAAEDAYSDKEMKKRKKSAETEVTKGRKQSPNAEEEDEVEVSGGSDGAKDASSGEEDKNDLEEERDNDRVEKEEDKESDKPIDCMKNGTADEMQLEDAADPEDEGRASRIKKATSVKSNKSPSKHVSKKTAPPVGEEIGVAIDSKNGSTKEQAGKSTKAIAMEKAAPTKKVVKKKTSRKSATADASDPGPSGRSKSQKEDKKKGTDKEKAMAEGKKARKKKEAKPAAKATKGQGRGKKNAGPSTGELHSVVSNILQEVDFNTATMADILKQLGSHFKMDLMDRKAEVKSIIEDVINNMTDDDDDDGDEDGDDLGEQ